MASLVSGLVDPLAIILLDIDKNIYTFPKECARIFYFSRQKSSDGPRGALRLSVSSVRLGRRGIGRKQKWFRARAPTVRSSLMAFGSDDALQFINFASAAGECPRNEL